MKKLLLSFSCLLIIAAVFFAITFQTPNRTLSSVGDKLAINLTSGINMGGFGDLASNLYMSKKIRALYPDATFNYVINPYSLKKLMILLPELNVLENQDEVMVDGMKYIVNRNQELPKADIVVGFSSPNMRNSLVKSANVAFAFAEYDDRHQHIVLGSDIIDGTPSYWLDSGPQNMGIYTTTEGVAKELTDQEFLETFNREVEIVGNKRLTYQRNQNLGFGYSNNLELVKTYVRDYEDIAIKNPDQKFTLIVKHIEDFDFSTIAKNVEIIEVKGVPFDMTSEMFHRINLPSLVTGDMSITMAIDHGVVPLYEQMPHKRPFSTELFRLIAEKIQMNAGSNPLWNEYIEKMSTLRGMHDSQLDFLHDLLEDEEFLRAMKQALREVKSEYSLLDNLKAMITKYQLDPEFFHREEEALDYIRSLRYPAHRRRVDPCVNWLSLFVMR